MESRVRISWDQADSIKTSDSSCVSVTTTFPTVAGIPREGKGGGGKRRRGKGRRRVKGEEERREGEVGKKM